MNALKMKNAEDLKSIMRQLPFPVTVVTTAVGKEKRGITIGSFTSLSMDPPLISFNLDDKAQMSELISKVTHFAVHFPSPEQSGICDHFAIPDLSGDEQFEGINYYRSPYGTPVLHDAGAVIHCRLYNRFQAGDHSIVVGEVMEINQAEKRANVLYYNRSYREVGAPVNHKTEGSDE